MPKNLFQDMVKVKRERQEEARRSLGNGSEKSSSYTPVEAREVETKKESKALRRASSDEEPTTKKSRKGGSRKSLWVVAGVSVLFFLFALSFLFAKAEVAINPRVEDLNLNESLSAVKDATAPELSFDLVVISDEYSQTVASSTQKDVSKAAEGTVIIYNNYSPASQQLDIDTRLEGSNGKIYKTKTKATVPGKTKDGKPGAVEVKVYGSAGGEAYNTGPIDFTIFGFKGTAKYSKFYARSKGNISGGLQGKFFTIADSEKANIITGLKEPLRAKLITKATEQTPAGFVLFDGATVLHTEEDNLNATGESSNIELKLKGTLYGVLFNEKELTKKIVAANVENYDGSEVYIKNIHDLDFSFASTTNLSEVPVATNLNFNISGPAKVVWKVDGSKIISELLGKSKKNFNQILSKYPNIESANLALSPFWKLSFPDKEDDVNILVNYPE